jgi:hypothetical protein
MLGGGSRVCKWLAAGENSCRTFLLVFFLSHHLTPFKATQKPSNSEYTV